MWINVRKKTFILTNSFVNSFRNVYKCKNKENDTLTICVFIQRVFSGSRYYKYKTERRLKVQEVLNLQKKDFAVKFQELLSKYSHIITIHLETQRNLYITSHFITCGCPK